MNRSIRRAGTMLAALTLSTAGFVATSAPASAALSDCPSRYACLWVNSGFSGQRWQGQAANRTMPSYISNEGSSMYNHGQDCEVHWYDDSQFNGGQLNLGLGRSISNLATMAPGWNDEIESMNWC